jgi:hypothetical protein
VLRKRKPKKLASSCPNLFFAKPRSRQSLKRDQAAHRRQVIADTREAVFARDHWCRRCHIWPRSNDAMHEVIFRSKLRGCLPEAVFNTRNCLRLCDGPGGCHRIIHAMKERIVFIDETLGCDGAVHFAPVVPKTIRETLP